jgi:hypothetical protein
MKCICWCFNNMARRICSVSCSWNYIYGFGNTKHINLFKARLIFMDYFVKRGFCNTLLEENGKWYRHKNIIAQRFLL